MSAIARAPRQRVTAQERAASRGSPTVLAEFEIEKGGGPLLVPVTLEISTGASQDGPCRIICRMFIDTGANKTFFSDRLRAELGGPTGKATIPSLGGGQIEVEKFKAPLMQAAGVPLHPDSEIGCCDLRELGTIVGEKVDGILGMDVLRKLVFSIDFDEGRLRLHEAADPAFGRPVQLHWNAATHGLVPVVFPDLGDGDPIAEFLVDTGGVTAFAGTLKAPAYERLADLGLVSSAAPVSDPNQSGALYVLGNRIKMKMGRLRGFSLGGYTHESLIFGSFPVNCLGLGYLSRYFVAFDFPHGKMYLRPGKEFARRDVFDLSALGLARRDGELVVTGAHPSGPAAAAGIQEYDVLVAIDGQRTHDMTAFAVKRRLCIEGRHSVVLRRHGVEERVDLVLGGIPGEKAPHEPPSREPSRGEGVRASGSTCR